jgi:glutathione peroxidase
MITFLLAAAMAPSTLYDFTMNDIDGKPRPLKEFRGKVALVVNVASKCGLTPQYEGLEALWRERRSAGLVVLGFPANDFRNQEPGTEQEIKRFCEERYNVTFPLFAKITVLGEERHPLYTWLVESGPRKDPIEWNFAKFVVGRDGKVRARFDPRTKPDDPLLIDAIERALAEK